MENSLINAIKQFEDRAKLLEAEKSIRAEWNNSTEAYVENFLDELNCRATFRHENQDNRFNTNTDFEDATPINNVLSQLQKQVDSSGIDTASGRYLGFIPGGGLYPAAIGDYIAAVTNHYTGIFMCKPGAVRMENQLIRWMANLIGFPHHTSGNLTSGGSMANLIALITAREAHELKANDYPRTVIYLTQNTHFSAQKALRVMGLQEAIKRLIPVDNNFCMSQEALEKTIKNDLAQGLIPWLIVASAGTTDTGSVDSQNHIIYGYMWTQHMVDFFH